MTIAKSPKMVVLLVVSLSSQKTYPEAVSTGGLPTLLRHRPAPALATALHRGDFAQRCGRRLTAEDATGGGAGGIKPRNLLGGQKGPVSESKSDFLSGSLQLNFMTRASK